MSDTSPSLQDILTEAFPEATADQIEAASWRLMAYADAQVTAAEKRGAVKALRGFAAGFALDNAPTSQVLAARVANDLMDRADLIEHGEVGFDGVRVESGEVAL